MKNLWSDKEAKNFVNYYSKSGINEDLSLRVYTSRLLGNEKKLVLHGGGNTSVKSISEGYDYYSREKIKSETILKICEKYKLICIDGFNQLNLNNEDTYDLVHTNPAGSKKIANFIFKSLQKEGFK